MMKTSKLISIVTGVMGLCFVFAANANAQCGVSLNKNNRLAFSAARSMPTSIPRISRQIEDPPPPGKDDEPATIVGLWNVEFISDNQIIDEGFDQYHSDGTEILNDTPPPAAGNVCLGVYEQTGNRSIKLRHPSWIYEPSNTFVIGIATILEQVTVDKNGRSFTGTFTVKLEDLSGNPLAPDITGQLKGSRITP